MGQTQHLTEHDLNITKNILTVYGIDVYMYIIGPERLIIVPDHGPIGPWAHGPMGLDRSRIDPGTSTQVRFILPEVSLAQAVPHQCPGQALSFQRFTPLSIQVRVILPEVIFQFSYPVAASIVAQS